MGVPGLLKYFQNNIPQAIGKSVSFRTDGLYLDMNGMVHPWAQKIFAYGESEGKEAYKGTKSDLENQMFSLIVAEVEMLTKRFKPELLVVAFDGPAPLAKIQQQRSRRFKNNDPVFSNHGWDSSAFSPGTSLMERLSVYVQTFLKRTKLAKRIIYSSHRVPGEGEHKMMTILRTEKSGNHVVVGKDADLILLAMLANTSTKNVYIYREEDVGEKQYLVIDSQLLGKEVASSLGTKDVIDFVILTFFVGNDFVRNVPEFQEIRTALPFLIGEYRKLNIDLSRWNPLLEAYQIDWNNFAKFLNKIVSNEKYIFRLNEKFLESQTNKIPTNTILSFQQSVIPGKQPYIDPTLFETIYYRHIFGIWDWYSSSPEIDKQPINQLCSSWLSTINWIILYYQGIPINISHQHLFHYSPMISSISTYLSNVEEETKTSWFSLITKVVPSLTPLEALVSVLPPSSFDLVPKEIQKNVLLLMPEMYPLKFKLDKLGHIVEFVPSLPKLVTTSLPEPDFDRNVHEHRVIPLLPLVSYYKVKEVMGMLSLKGEAKVLNTIEKDILI